MITRGFAAMEREQQRAIARKGGRAAHERGRAHEFSPDEARAAGRKGGVAAQQRGSAHRLTESERREGGRRGGRVVSADRTHMAAIGRKGGRSPRRPRGGAPPAAADGQDAR